MPGQIKADQPGFVLGGSHPTSRKITPAPLRKEFLAIMSFLKKN